MKSQLIKLYEYCPPFVAFLDDEHSSASSTHRACATLKKTAAHNQQQVEMSTNFLK